MVLESYGASSYNHELLKFFLTYRSRRPPSNDQSTGCGDTAESESGIASDETGVISNDATVDDGSRDYIFALDGKANRDSCDTWCVDAYSAGNWTRFAKCVPVLQLRHTTDILAVTLVMLICAYTLDLSGNS